MAELVAINDAGGALTSQALRRLFRIEPDSGKLFWRERPLELFKSAQAHSAWNTKYAGTEALTAIGGHGYRHGQALGRHLRAHVVIWMIAHGDIPKGFEIDHIDRNKTNNRLANLRLARRRENALNNTGHKRRESRFKGVSYIARRGVWQAVATIDGRSKYIGRFPSEIDAARAYDRVVREAHGEFAYTNIKEAANG